MFVMLALTGATRRTIDQAVERLWSSKCATPGGCPVTGATIFGRALAAILEDPALCARLNHIESVEEFVAARLYWRKPRATISTFASAAAADWQQEFIRARAAGPVHVTQIGVETLHSIAELLAAARSG
jgi:hypothetical protein